MVKLKKTYSRVKNKKPKITINVTNNFFINVTNNYFTTSKSGSSEDEFDKLLKGSTNSKVVHSTPASSSIFEPKYFLKRQDTFPSYNSDVSSGSTNCVQLFRDTLKDSRDLYSLSSLPSPPDYTQVKNKLVKVTSIAKKRDKVTKKKLKKRVKKVNCNQESKMPIAVSSTPTNPHLYPSKHKCFVSPINPPETPNKNGLRNESECDSFADEEIKENQSNEKQHSIIGMTALLENFGNLGLASSQAVMKDEETKNNSSVSISKNINTRKKTKVANNALFTMEGLQKEKKKEESELMGKLDSCSIEQEITNNLAEKQVVVQEDLNEPMGFGIGLSNISTRKNKSKENSQLDEMAVDSFHQSRPPPESTEVLVHCKNQERSRTRNITSGFLNSQTDLLIKYSTAQPHLKISLSPGKRWRRSFIRQKRPDPKRSTMGPALIMKLMKESNLDTTTSSDFFTAKNKDESVWCGTTEMSTSSLFLPNMSEIMKNISTRQRRTYDRNSINKNFVFDMDNIPEESLCLSGQNIVDEMYERDQSIVPSNTELFSPKPSERFIKTAMEPAPEGSDGGREVMERTIETPPIFRDLEALSALSTRKKSSRKFSKSNSELETPQDKEMSEACLDESKRQIGEMGVLLRCGQLEPLPFSEAYPDELLTNCQKIGEGVYGEVFMVSRQGEEKSVVKIIAVEGSQIVNNAPQKQFDEVLSELIIAEELSLLREGTKNRTSGFCELKRKFCLQGEYPSLLIDVWKKFDKEKRSENDCPNMFGCDQLYIALELAHAGQALESYKFGSAREAFSVFMQTTFSLAAAEWSLDFEHRDLHIGNILVKTTSEDSLPFILNNVSYEFPTYGIQATIIDFTLSRISFKDDVLFFDLAKDPELFTAEGDYQFDIYRLMRDDLENTWDRYAPITNIRWLHYLIDKLTTSVKYHTVKRKKIHEEYLKKLAYVKEIMIDFTTTSDLAEFFLESFTETVALVI